MENTNSKEIITDDVKKMFMEGWAAEKKREAAYNKIKPFLAKPFVEFCRGNTGKFYAKRIIVV